ncbi:MAG: threonine synthase [Gammaproteobacteria bacterium]|nr:threonine synthase [Gammaproteobacteria bacterium]
MNYVSTRGASRGETFASVLLSGLAPDGGLYVPETLKPFSADEVDSYREASYAAVAKRIIGHFAGDSLSGEIINASVDSALSRFHHAAIAPLRQLEEDTWLLELFHGPTFAFKDYALQIVGELIDRQLSAENRRATILCATSGDTGAAAAAAFAGRANVDVVVLHPLGRVSDVQRRQMTTLPDENVRNFAVKGDFDDCQSMVKKLFLDADAKPLNLTAVNSINWARIICQTVYYVWSSLKLSASGPVNYVVPTGNFGNILAADIARILGFPVGKLMLSSNENDVLPRFFSSGSMECRDTVETLSPSMDIQLSSNFERALWMALDNDSATVADVQKQLSESGSYSLVEDSLYKLRQRYSAAACNRDQALEEMRRAERESAVVLCPHTATAAYASRHSGFDGTTVVVGTAHPAKFTQAVEIALGHPADMPKLLAPVLEAEERFETIDTDAAGLRDLLLNKQA